MPVDDNRIRFLLGNHLVETDPSHLPSTTILNFLRSLPDFKGVKEGCAEGDCGACTVVVAYPVQGKLIYMAVNSCLVFLPWLHGKQLITVEHLINEGELHPVQQWMVDLYGSQCGFCTPGIVMSLFALFKSNLPPTRENAVRSLSGNLCRCTGYQPVLEAAMKALNAEGSDHFSKSEPEVLSRLLPLQSANLHLTDGKQHYFRPSTLEAALEIRSQYPEALLVSGATDLALRQSKKFEFLPELLDLTGIEELRNIKETPAGWEVGALANIEEVWNSSLGNLEVINDVFSVFASHQIRNMATLAGNIASASPIGDILPVLMALKASVELTSRSGKRQVVLEEFIRGYRKTDLQPEEIITCIRIPFPPANGFIRFYKFSKRRELDISTVSLAARLEMDSSRLVTGLILAYGGMAEKTSRVSKTEEALGGKTWTREVVESVFPVLDAEFSPLSDARSGKEARIIAARNLLLKFYLDTIESGGGHD